MIKFIETKTPIKICDIGASPKDKTKFIEELFISTNSTLIGFEPNNDEFEKQRYKIMREYLGADDIRRLQLEKIKESNSINSQSFCTN